MHILFLTMFNNISKTFWFFIYYENAFEQFSMKQCNYLGSKILPTLLSCLMVAEFIETTKFFTCKPINI